MFHTSHKFHKLKSVTQDDIPTKSQIQQHLGASLAQVFVDYSHHEIIKLLDPISSDAIQAWPKKQEILKSYIHRDILELGNNELKKFQIKVEAVTKNKLKNEFAEKCFMLEAEKRFAINRNTEKIHAKYEEYFKFTQQELEKKLQIEWADANATQKKEIQKAVVKAQIDTTHDVLRRMRPQIFYIITSLYNDLDQSYRAQREKMIVDFNIIMRKQHVKLDARIEEVEKKKMEELHKQRYELETQNATDIIYIVCIERLRSNLQINMIREHFEEQIKSLHELVVKQDKAIDTMRERIIEYQNKNIMLQEKIAAITKEFQKFINFVFDTMPEHADFLLPLDLLFVNNTNKKDS